MAKRRVKFADDTEYEKLPPKIRRGSLALTIFGILLLGSCRYFSPWAKDSALFRIQLSTEPSDAILQQGVDRVLNGTPLIDGHNDLLIVIRLFYLNHINNERFKRVFRNGGFPNQVDVPRLRASKLGGTFWSAFVPCPKNGSLEFVDENYDEVVRATLEQIDLFNRMSSSYPEYFDLVTSAQQAHSAFQDGRFIALLAIEGLHQIGNSPSILRLYHKLGVRYATLTWNCHNAYADAALVEIGDSNDGNTKSIVAPPHWGGLSLVGRDMVAEMNRIGMIIDLAHVSADTMRQVLEGSGHGPDRWNGSLAPPIFSHSSAFAICPHPRNVPDDVLYMVQRRKSLVMVNFNPKFISCERKDNDPETLPTLYAPNATIQQVVKHITYIGDLIGYDHVGIGSDFDGIDDGPKGLEDVSKFPTLVAELLKHGVSDEACGKIIGGNLLRVWQAVQDVAENLQDTMLPLEDQLEKPWF
ncbi:unnamed protein product [Periconia digitata]|uniref:Dipeptidase n=1 Tax=Periconia digitata TaxID=1303443 RepID=A0A9W4UL63_9PLEO|nr:unnamed protein product [Periconia digitata]